MKLNSGTRVTVLIEAGSAAYSTKGKLVFDYEVGDDIYVQTVGGGVTIIPAARVIYVEEYKLS